MANIYGFKQYYLVDTRDANDNNDYNIGFLKYEDNRPQIVQYNPDLTYNPASQTLTVPNLTANITPQKTTWSYSQQDQREGYGETHDWIHEHAISSLRASINPEGTKSIKISVMITCEFRDPGDPYQSMFYITKNVNPDKGNQTIPLRSTNPPPDTERIYGLGIAPPTVSFHYNADSTLEVGRYIYIDDPPFNPTIPNELKYTAFFTNKYRRALILNRTLQNNGHSEAGMSNIIVEEIDHPFEKTQIDDIYTITSGTPPAGESNYWGEFTQLTTSITPLSSSNKIKITICIMGEFASNATHNTMFFLKRTIGTGALQQIAYLRSSQTTYSIRGISTATISYHLDAITTPEALFIEYIDEPNTTDIVSYTPIMEVTASNIGFRLNSVWNTSDVDEERGMSSVLLEEYTGKKNFNSKTTDSIITYTPSGLQVYTDIPVLSVSITPSSNKSYIKISAMIVGEFSNQNNPFNSLFALKCSGGSRGTVILSANTYDQRFISEKISGITAPAISYHLESVSTLEACNLQFIDYVEDTSTLTYTVVFILGIYTGSFKLNSTTNGYEVGLSNILVEEMPSV